MRLEQSFASCPAEDHQPAGDSLLLMVNYWPFR